ncbi:MAG: hypothetical protein JW751_27700 [Polyangiaceae bacterium]|nr:hypothetical protein [Polyangiaceae bacterium]
MGMATDLNEAPEPDERTSGAMTVEDGWRPSSGFGLDPKLLEDVPTEAQDMKAAVQRAMPRGAGSPRRERRWFWRLCLATVGGAVFGVAILWWAVHWFDWAGPLVADTLRSILGVDRVARLEDLAYGIEDRVHRLTRGDASPQARWNVPTSPSAAPSAASSVATGSNGTPELPVFRPTDVGAVHVSWSAPGDGQWVPMEDPRRPGELPYLYKTLLHPDRNRSWAEVFVVAIDLRRVVLHLLPGYQEPQSDTPEAKERLLHRSPARPAVIPASDHEALLAAFNGGFKTEHGHYGMRIDGITIAPPRGNACAVSLFPGDELRIMDWDALAPRAEEVIWYRQAPRCMVEGGKLHPLLSDPHATWWGATLDKETVIRRSAIGVDPRHEVLFVGITNSTTAQALAQGMRHAGADAVAQLDVNWSYPKFFTFAPKAAGGSLVAVPLTDDFDFSEGELLRERAMRDFFYVTRRDPAATRAWVARHAATQSAATGAAPSSSAAASAAPSADAAPPAGATPLPSAAANPQGSAVAPTAVTGSGGS